ncbi:helix-turn-helix domain-containing protein [Mycobacterium adipatum]|uniref:helix-turn-helix domain-containing protein n=1 Tax=Mycobacterium adipatum TaxID=1682113 RepID=UPI0034E0A5A6
MGAEANRRRARQAARRQSELAQQALDVLQAGLQQAGHPLRWIQALEHRIEHPEATLTELADSMSPPMTKHAYAALLRRALLGGGVDVGPNNEKGFPE